MLVVVPLSALTDHTLKAPELLSGLITASPRATPRPSRAAPALYAPGPTSTIICVPYL